MKLLLFIIPISLYAAESSSSSSGDHQEITILDHKLDNEAISKAIFKHYFHCDHSPSRTIEISLKKKLNELTESDQDQFKYALIQQFAMNHHNHEHLKVINELLLKSLTDAMTHTEQRIDNRWTKKQSAYMTAGTAVVTCLITSIVVIIIQFL